MSVRAYRIDKFEYKENPTFNLWNEENGKLLNFLLEKGLSDGLNSEGVGITYVAVSILEEALQKTPMPKSTKETIKEDIKWAKEMDKEYIFYYCF